MKTQPIVPAHIDFGAAPDHLPRAPDFGDVYHPQVGALAQARHVFLGGNRLPQRWAGRSRFVILETGFGLGNNFLATWDAWRADPARCQRLHFVSIERHPPTREDLARAHAGSALPELAAELVHAWPPLTPNLHTLEFEDGRVQLLLALGDVAALLPGLRVQADAFFLDGFAPACNAEMWQPRVLAALGRKAARGATLATWSVAREVREGLATAGFELQRAAGIGGKREITIGQWAPRFVPRHLPDAAVAAREAVVVGAGLAGAAVAAALARQGLAVTVLERHAGAAGEASGNLAGIFHGTVNAADGPYARLYRAAALQAQRDHGTALARGAVAGCVGGLLRLDLRPEGLPGMHALLRRAGLPAGYVQALSAEAASQRAGARIPAPAWHYPGGGWLSPPQWVVQALAEPGVRFVPRVDVASLARTAAGWALHDRQGRLVATAPLVVLAHTASAAGLLAGLGLPRWPLHHTRGQVTYWAGDAGGPLRLPVAGDGYALPLPDGGVLCGATRQDELAEAVGVDATVRSTDHELNLERLLRLTGLPAPPDPARWLGRVGWRLHADDRLPIVGALPRAELDARAQRRDQARLLPRESGLFVLTALGARGLTLAPLLARLVAAQATGSPWPLEQDLADAIDPARWLVRSARAAAGEPRIQAPAGG
ncbi:MAG: FAD-dependent 5-carboxymethylaminomethyl-2-thiouridine(34) oxidoreductase MnmC [Rubrivivax sp.]|nr:FAD-dependent 5-carboxymethylaminomethyl-2-thiouridine(34) oxidoreductase MnmC [Rubrivivax sp.]